MSYFDDIIERYNRGVLLSYDELSIIYLLRSFGDDRVRQKSESN